MYRLFFLFSFAVIAAQPNLLIITVDDMSADSLGCFGAKLADTSPRIDALAERGVRFTKAHVQVGNCKPSRNVMWSGRYPHNNGVEGFYSPKKIDYPVLADLAKGAGYYTAIRGKVSHSTPIHPYPAWDMDATTLPDGRKTHNKDAESYGESTTAAISAAKNAGKPFCLMVNISDPHKPFYAEGKGGITIPDKHVPSRVFTPDEVPIPGFLFDDPVVRKELAHYYSSVRRADDCAGAVLDALEAAGETERTAILFLSDHGMPLPFAKTQLYHHSTHTPLAVIWPGVTQANTFDREHMVSAVDFLPTLLDIAGIAHPDGLDGRSFASVLRGKTQKNRSFVVKEYNENAGGSRDPMRGVQDSRFLYLFNPWSNGERVMRTATQGTSTYRRMKALAPENAEIAARLALFDHRVPEELFDIQKDPDCLHNLATNPEYAPQLAQQRQRLETWMARHKDPMAAIFATRDDAEAREAAILTLRAEADARRAVHRKAGRTKKKGGAQKKNKKQ
jgi:N-sulfoglucosamine sulfohydrolase